MATALRAWEAILWTGDLGVACVLWNCIVEGDRFPTLDHF
jgi:hypothetical protein